MPRTDPHSCRDDAQPVVDHLSWRVRADFGARILDGVAELRLRQTGPETGAGGPLDLDTRDLTVTSVMADGTDAPFELGAPDPVMGSRLRIELPAATTVLRIRYRTSPRSSALQWCAPEQTADGTHPFLYSQCQTIHARSMLPIQDTPGVRFSYDAALEVPAGLTALMSASRTGQAGATFRFAQRQPIPAYLLALAVGRLEGREVGPRSTVWAEPSQLAAAAWEFAGVEQMLATAEQVLGPYVWGTADLLVLPPSYPYGGMENPQLIFVTPTLIAGDRSLVAVVAHEIAHAWTGNLVTAASLDHFWVNEGFTVFAEREITARLIGRDLTELHAAIGRADLEADLRYLADRPELTRLRLDLRGVDPDVASSHVALEKGYLFLRAIAKSAGADRFAEFLRSYLAEFRFRSVTSEQVVAFARDQLPNTVEHATVEHATVEHATVEHRGVDYDEWLHGTGLPADAPVVTSPLLDAVRVIGQAAPELGVAAKWSADEWQAYLAGLRPPVPAGLLAELADRYQLTSSANPEILRLWLTVALRSGYREAVPAAVDLLGRVGRLKYLKPLYDALAGDPGTSALARDCFERNRGRYHPIAVAVIGARLALAAGSGRPG